MFWGGELPISVRPGVVLKICMVQAGQRAPVASLSLEAPFGRVFFCTLSAGEPSLVAGLVLFLCWYWIG